MMIIVSILRVYLLINNCNGINGKYSTIFFSLNFVVNGLEGAGTNGGRTGK